MKTQKNAVIVGILVALGLVFAGLSLIGCEQPTSEPKTVPVTGVTLSHAAVTLAVGDTEPLTATVEPEDATNKSVSWESDDNDVATVSDSGVVTAVSVGTATITVTTADSSFTKECAVTVKPVPASIAVTKQPDNPKIAQGEELDLTGLEVTVTYSEGSGYEPEVVEIVTEHITGFDPNQLGEQTLTITYGGKTATFKVMVVALSKIEITKQPTKTTYAIGEQLNIEGLEVTATFTDDDTEILNITMDHITGFDSSTPGEKTVTVTYGGKTATFTVTVNSVPVEDIIGVPTTASVGTPLDLFGTVMPDNATYKTISWSVNTGSATITGNSLTATAAGEVVITATIANGTAQGEAFTKNFTVTAYNGILVTSGADDGPGTLRQAISSVSNGGTIVIADSVGIINLNERVDITKSLLIEGNGVTITRDPSRTTVSYSTPLLDMGNGATVTIRRVHFKDGRNTTYGGAIVHGSGTLTLESCIFSGNQVQAITEAGGGILNVRGCTFYNNGVSYVIYVMDGDLTLTGNLFDGTIDGVVDAFATVTSLGYNVFDVPFITGWEGPSDRHISPPILSPSGFKLFSGSEAEGIITTLPENYPAFDFYGNPITAPAAAGAVQGTETSGYILNVSVNNSALGNVTVTSQPNSNGLYSGNISITATPEEDCNLAYWLVDGENKGSTNPLEFIMTYNTVVQAVFVESGYSFNASVNDNTRGDINVSISVPSTVYERYVGGEATIMATPKGDYKFGYWLVNGEAKGSANPLHFTITDDTVVLAVFGLITIDNDEDFDQDPLLEAIFNVSNVTEWNSAITAINGGENRNYIRSYIINILADFSIPGITSSTFTPSGIKVSIRGSGRTLSLSSNGSILRVGSGQQVILRDLALNGRSSNNNSLVNVSGGTLVMRSNAKITGNTWSASASNSNVQNSGGGVYINNGSTLIMYSGEISGNTVSTSVTRTNTPLVRYSEASGGGVYVSGTFIMYGGVISGNTVSASGSDTYVPNGNGVESSARGGGVYGTVRIINGTIYGNTESTTSLRNTTSGNGTNSGAALYSTARRGTFNGDTWVSNGDLTTTNSTIRVVEGNLQ